MVTTRSNKTATAQTHLEDYTKPPSKDEEPKPASPTQSKQKKSKESKSPQKRKAVSPSAPEIKKQRTATPPLKQEEPTPKKKMVAKSRSGQTKLSTANVSEELASAAETAEYKKKKTPSPKTKVEKDSNGDNDNDNDNVESAEKPASAVPKKEDTSEDAGDLKQESKNDHDGATEPEPENDIILINRSPVLDLWAATVTHFVHPSLSWETCLSAGSAIATLCAVSKGRSIGVINDNNNNPHSNPNIKGAADTASEIEVMGFKLQIKDDLVVVGKDKKKGNEGALKAKFGARDYERVKQAFEEALGTWGDDGEGLNRTAFAMYEDFRPSVAAGQKGWGRKGELSLDRVLETIAKG